MCSDFCFYAILSIASYLAEKLNIFLLIGRLCFGIIKWVFAIRRVNTV